LEAIVKLPLSYILKTQGIIKVLLTR
jgi:hypothetical protein